MMTNTLYFIGTIVKLIVSKRCHAMSIGIHWHYWGSLRHLHNMAPNEGSRSPLGMSGLLILSGICKKVEIK